MSGENWSAPSRRRDFYEDLPKYDDDDGSRGIDQHKDKFARYNYQNKAGGSADRYASSEMNENEYYRHNDSFLRNSDSAAFNPRPKQDQSSQKTYQDDYYENNSFRYREDIMQDEHQNSYRHYEDEYHHQKYYEDSEDFNIDRQNQDRKLTSHPKLIPLTGDEHYQTEEYSYKSYDKTREREKSKYDDHRYRDHAIPHQSRSKSPKFGGHDRSIIDKSIDMKRDRYRSLSPSRPSISHKNDNVMSKIQKEISRHGDSSDNELVNLLSKLKDEFGSGALDKLQSILSKHNDEAIHDKDRDMNRKYEPSVPKVSSQEKKLSIGDIVGLLRDEGSSSSKSRIDTSHERTDYKKVRKLNADKVNKSYSRSPDSKKSRRQRSYSRDSSKSPHRRKVRKRNKYYSRSISRSPSSRSSRSFSRSRSISPSKKLKKASYGTTESNLINVTNSILASNSASQLPIYPYQNIPNIPQSYPPTAPYNIPPNMPPFFPSVPPPNLPTWPLPPQTFNPLTNQWYYNYQYPSTSYSFNPSVPPPSSVSTQSQIPISQQSNTLPIISSTISSSKSSSKNVKTYYCLRTLSTDDVTQNDDKSSKDMSVDILDESTREKNSSEESKVANEKEKSIEKDVTKQDEVNGTISSIDNSCTEETTINDSMDEHLNNDHCIFVGNLPDASTNQTLMSYFSTWGDVVNAQIIYDKITKGSKGFGFVSFSKKESAKEVLGKQHQINNQFVDVRTVDTQTPPPNYICRLCLIPGHYLSQCKAKPPIGYLCRKCFVPGHFYNSCPLNQIDKTEMKKKIATIKDTIFLCDPKRVHIQGLNVSSDTIDLKTSLKWHGLVTRFDSISANDLIVEMKTESETEKLVSSLNGSTYHGNKLTVQTLDTPYLLHFTELDKSITSEMLKTELDKYGNVIQVDRLEEKHAILHMQSQEIAQSVISNLTQSFTKLELSKSSITLFNKNIIMQSEHAQMMEKMFCDLCQVNVFSNSKMLSHMDSKEHKILKEILYILSKDQEIIRKNFNIQISELLDELTNQVEGSNENSLELRDKYLEIDSIGPLITEENVKLENVKLENVKLENDILENDKLENNTLTNDETEMSIRTEVDLLLQAIIIVIDEIITEENSKNALKCESQSDESLNHLTESVEDNKDDKNLLSNGMDSAYLSITENDDDVIAVMKF